MKPPKPGELLHRYAAAPFPSRYYTLTDTSFTPANPSDALSGEIGEVLLYLYHRLLSDAQTEALSNCLEKKWQLRQ